MCGTALRIPLWEFSGLDKLDFAQMPQSVYEFIVCILRHFTAHLIYLTDPEKSQGGRYISDRDTLIFYIYLVPLAPSDEGAVSEAD